MRRGSTRVLLSFGVALASAAAAAQSMTATLTAFGFYGKWAMDCSAPAAPNNIVRTVSAPGLEPVRWNESAGQSGSRYLVKAVKVVDANTIVIRIQLNDDIIEDLTMAKRDGRLRTMVNQKSTGETLVRDGVILSVNRPTPWLNKCS
jgi:hypothetical protein